MKNELVVVGNVCQHEWSRQWIASDFSFLLSGLRRQGRKKMVKRLSSPRAATKPRLMNRERIFNFNSAINSSLTRFAVAAEAPKRLISMCVTEISIYGLFLSRLKTLSIRLFKTS